MMLAYGKNGKADGLDGFCSSIVLRCGHHVLLRVIAGVGRGDKCGVAL